MVVVRCAALAPADVPRRMEDTSAAATAPSRRRLHPTRPTVALGEPVSSSGQRRDGKLVHCLQEGRSPRILGAFIKSDLRDLALRRSGSRLRHGANARIDEEAVMTSASRDRRQTDPAVRYRAATEHDAADIAALHADSWRRHYRGAYLDSYLDGDVVADRLEAWTSRLAPPRSNQYTVCAEADGDTVGFAHTVFDHDPEWGALLDNLHVQSGFKGHGIGTRLLSETARELTRCRSSESLYLWVLEQNVAAQSFYDARGGNNVETVLRGPFPGGGYAMGHRYVWPDPASLIQEA
jgi:ribosomal protein S18 acetylase RimI-like enzyme